jgi:hypothetical protein
VDGGPRWVFDIGTAGRLQDPGLDQIVEGRVQLSERSRLVGSLTGRMVGRCVCGVEEAWLGAGKLEVGGADGLSRSRAPVGVRGPARTWLMRLPIRLARIVKTSSRTAARRASRSAKCRYAALGTTPTLRVTSRRTTAPGPPERASSRPA